MFFEICGEIADVETFAVDSGIRELPRLRKLYGKGRWRSRLWIEYATSSNENSGLCGLHAEWGIRGFTRG